MYDIIKEAHVGDRIGPKERARNKQLAQKWCKQRIKRGYCDMDLWNMDDFLIELLPDMLERLAETASGYPDKRFESIDEWRQFLTNTTSLFRESHEAAKHFDYKAADTLQKEAFGRLSECFFDLWD